MKDIVKFWINHWRNSKTYRRNSKQIKQNLNKDGYEAIQDNIQINEKATKKTLQRKFKKYNHLKLNSKPAATATDIQEDNEDWV